jgi:hypothetical protein
MAVRSSLSRSAAITIVALLSVAATSCRRATDGSVTDRLWVSTLPTTPKAPLTAFITSRTTGARFIGAYFDGSAYRGAYDVFEWRNEGEQSANLRFLQDGRKVTLRYRTCEPSRGFDYCILIEGDPIWARKFQSRKRWTVRRGRRSDVNAADLLHEFGDLAASDPQLAAIVDGKS